jgi:hypothetical protein
MATFSRAIVWDSSFPIVSHKKQLATFVSAVTPHFSQVYFMVMA